ncbi:MAG: bis(5'-nucleosyl)-tetraphosphatase (symmetrical) YqeK [Oscillospiraceae bacterium]|nr:bis(5'-nucleosyl)-tetraphosphatase (symmetrical) YqeK [Oscillospiraceae bacterium]
MQFEIKASTDISREDLRRVLIFRCADKLVPEDVLRQIYEEGLYDTDWELKNLSLERLREVVISLLKPSRVAHVMGCCETAVKMAERWGADATDAARAALLHDVTKALDGPLQLTLCESYGIILDQFSAKNTKTLHALTGSLVAERIFGENVAVVQAIRSHTTGKGNMNTLEKIIYVADYMEPNRDFPGVEKLRRLAFTDLDKALKLGLEMTLAMLKEQGREISPETQQALMYLES